MKKVYPSMDILKQLKPLDAQILNFLYELVLQNKNDSLSSIGFSDVGIKDQFNINQDKYELSIDNLTRVRCAVPYRLESNLMQIPVLRGGKNEYVNTTVDMGYKSISLTRLGKHFVEACATNKKMSQAT